MNNNSEQCLLSIVVPVFNGDRYIKATIESLVRISEKVNVEIIFQDALSTDKTSEIISEYALKHKNFIHFREKDSGQSDAINIGIKKAKGMWVTWLCADDLLLDGFFEMMLLDNFLCGQDVIYGDCIFLQNDDIIPAIGTEEYKKGKLSKKRLFIQQPGTCILREKWNEVGGLDINLNWVMDYDLFLRLENKGCNFSRYESFISVARIHKDAKTSSGSFRRFIEYCKIFSTSHKKNLKYFSLFPYSTYLLEYVIKKMEAGKSNGVMLNKILEYLHVIFWKLARPIEGNTINKRFKQQEKAIRENINILDFN